MKIFMLPASPPSSVSKSLFFKVLIRLDKLGPAGGTKRSPHQTCTLPEKVPTEKGTKLESLKTSKLTSPLQAETTCRAAVL